MIVGAALLFAYLAIGAAVDPGELLPWDEPVHEWVQDEAPRAVVDAFEVLTWLGANHVVFPVGLVLAVVARRRSPRLAGIVLASVAARPVVQVILKPVVGRLRPTGEEFAFPSGHTAAAVSLYLLLPFVATAWAAGRRGRGAAVVGAAALIVAVAASRVILGVHWLSDVVGSMLLGVLWWVVLGRAVSLPPAAGSARRGGPRSPRPSARATTSG